MHGSAETPQHQGQIERFNRTAKGLLFVWITENWRIADEQWHSIGLEECEAKYMRTEHRTLGMTPDMYVLGRMKTPALRAQHNTIKGQLPCATYWLGQTHLFPV